MSGGTCDAGGAGGGGGAPPDAGREAGTGGATGGTGGTGGAGGTTTTDIDESCGCRIGASSRASDRSAFALLLIGLVARARRRRAGGTTELATRAT